MLTREASVREAKLVDSLTRMLMLPSKLRLKRIEIVMRHRYEATDGESWKWIASIRQSKIKGKSCVFTARKTE